MSYKSFPLFSTPKNYQFKVTINGNNLNLRFRYNDRDDTWYLTFLDNNNTVLLSGIPALSNVVNMTRTYRTLPKGLLGDFLFFDKTGNGADVSSDSLGAEIDCYFIDYLPPLAEVQKI